MFSVFVMRFGDRSVRDKDRQVIDVALLRLVQLSTRGVRAS